MATLVNRQTGREAGGLVRGSRGAVVALAWLFAAGVVVQVFLAGLSLFESASYWADHEAFGRGLGFIPVPLLLLALVGRLPLRLVVLAAAVVVLYGLQFLLANVDEGYLAALHPVNAFALLGTAAQLGSQTRGLPPHPA
jgi:hypothetical protein